MTPEDHRSDQVMGSLLPFQRQVQTCGIRRLITVQCVEWLSYTLSIPEAHCPLLPSGRFSLMLDECRW